MSCSKLRICSVICSSARTGGIDDVVEESGHVALNFVPNCTDLNPTELVCGGFRNRIAFTNLKEMRILGGGESIC